MALYGAVPFESLFRRCIKGCPEKQPLCPECPGTDVCSMVPPTCNECAKTLCAPANTVPSVKPTISKSSSSGPNVGAIAGGVIGGVVVIAAVTYLVWRFCIKNKRQQYEQENWGQDPEEEESAEKDFTMRRDARASTHTVGSIASTVLTRASNIIQIAYIPGVTNRSAPTTPGLLVPPVPPIPIMLSPTSSSPRYEQEHFFMPGDLRDSTYSGMSDRTSYARHSVASTIYGKNAVVSPVPVQTMIRGKAAVVSVKPNGLGSPGEFMPPVPNVDYGRFGNPPASPAFSVGSTFLNSASAATQMRPSMIKVTSVPKKDSQSNQERDSRRSLLSRDSNANTLINDTPMTEQGPFSDRQEVPTPNGHLSGSSLSAVIEEATRKARTGKTGDKKTPFGDENEVKEA